MTCNDCGRKFAEDRIDKHNKVCRKVFVEKRKAFDTAEQRKATDANGKGLEEDPYSKRMRMKTQKQTETVQKKEGKIPKWKLQSMQLRKGISAADNAKPKENYGGQGGYGGQPQEYEEEDDRTGCPHCGRKFNEQAAQRHIAFCATKSK